MHWLFIDFKKAYDSVKREVLYNILLEFGIPKKLVRLIKMCLNETYSKIHVGKRMSYTFSFRMLFSSALEYSIKKVQENQAGLN
jgi:hypothetical protein